MTGKPLIVDDVALEVAREVLDGLVCECGDLRSDHISDSGRPHGHAECTNCVCELFEPVAFDVTRRPA
jgi:hypothetical protein